MGHVSWPQASWYGPEDSSCLESVHCVGFQCPKNTIMGKFWLFWGLLYRPPITDESQIWYATADPQQTLTCQNLSRSVYSIALWRQKNPFFAVFWTSAFSDVDSWRQSEKVEHGCTTTNLPTGIQSHNQFLVLTFYYALLSNANTDYPCSPERSRTTTTTILGNNAQTALYMTTRPLELVCAL